MECRGHEVSDRWWTGLQQWRTVRDRFGFGVWWWTGKGQVGDRLGAGDGKVEVRCITILGKFGGKSRTATGKVGDRLRIGKE